MNYELTLGLEVHTELSTKTKIFCNCTTEFGGEQNTHVCEGCLGMPGALPVLNKSVVDYAIKTGLATNCSITQFNKFDRKNYFYPDLPKAYQISQLYFPICQNGFVEVNTADGDIKKVRIKEIHIERNSPHNHISLRNIITGHPDATALIKLLTFFQCKRRQFNLASQTTV